MTKSETVLTKVNYWLKIYEPTVAEEKCWVKIVEFIHKKIKFHFLNDWECDENSFIEWRKEWLNWWDGLNKVGFQKINFQNFIKKNYKEYNTSTVPQSNQKVTTTPMIYCPALKNDGKKFVKSFANCHQ